MSKGRVCIIDDEVITRMDLREMIIDAGYEVVGEGRDGLTAIELVKSNNPDLTIMDVKMPGLDGIDAAKLMAIENLGPVLLLTAFTDQKFISRAQNVGIMGYLVKPVSEVDLVAAIPLAIQRHRDMERLKTQIVRLNEHIENSKVVERAKGVLMVKYGLSEDESHRRLQKLSMQKNLNMARAAMEILTTK